ncbi:MAG: AMP phosphorylase [Candidatus Nanohaloarchaeota archaeon QJJ-7]|nr:AMP phosphorylase [Candidatus Nanohaloarchaeota archaeon QJJ-7]
MNLEIEQVDMETEAPIVILNRNDAEDLGANPLDRVQISDNGQKIVGIVDITDELVEEGKLGVTDRLSYLEGEVELLLASRPESVKHIKEKLDDEELEKEDLEEIVKDINENRLNDVEMGAYVTGIYTNGLSLQETQHLTEAMTDIGDVIEWEDDILADKHSIGGVAGNRVTPIVVPIVAAAGIKIPKTSSRAITSPAGTADTMEVFADVDFSIEEIKELVEETNGCMVWGGSVNLSPVDDKIIRAEHPLSLDPEGQVIASVLSKKKSAGSTHSVIDIPYGEGSKVDNLSDARDLAKKFKRVGDHIDMEIECTITTGGEPIGRGIGPVMEARDVLQVLEGNGPEDLKLKSLRLVDIIFEMAGVEEEARDILESGEALEKFREIIEAQNGDPDIDTEDLELGEHRETVKAGRDGFVTHISNEMISDIARRAGAPKDLKAGIDLHRKVGAEVEEEEELFTVYAEREDKLEEAIELAEDTEAVRLRGKEASFVERV